MARIFSIGLQDYLKESFSMVGKKHPNRVLALIINLWPSFTACILPSIWIFRLYSEKSEFCSHGDKIKLFSR